MNIFPFIDGAITQDIETETENSVPREYAWDFLNNELIMQDGKVVIVEGLEAIKVWIYKALKTVRYKYIAYSWDYGNELENIIGSSDLSKGLKESEIKRFIEEALLININIKSITNLVATIEEEKISLEFTAVTDYGEVGISV